MVTDFVAECIGGSRIDIGQTGKGKVFIHAGHIGQGCALGQELQEGIERRRFTDAWLWVGWTGHSK